MNECLIILHFNTVHGMYIMASCYIFTEGSPTEPLTVSDNEKISL
jgi:hypothetical protein